MFKTMNGVSISNPSEACFEMKPRGKALECYKTLKIDYLWFPLFISSRLANA